MGLDAGSQAGDDSKHRRGGPTHLSGLDAGGNAIRLPSQLSLVLRLLLPGLLLCGGLGAQNDPGADIRFRLRTNVELVLVPVTVKDGDDNLVSDLKREDFRLVEDGEEQPIRYFSVDPFPLSVVVLVDGALSRSAYQGVRETLPVLAGAFGPDDEFALTVFDTYPRSVLDFTREPEQLRAAIRSLAPELSPAPSGISGGPLSAGPRLNTVPVAPRVPSTLPQARQPLKSLNDALFAAGMALRHRERGRRRTIIIVSDGLNSRLNLHSFEETRDLLLAEDISVYALGVGNARFALGTTVLSDYARATGGDLYAPMTGEALAHAYLRVVEQARYQYTLVYAARPAPGGRQFRRIQVQVRRPGLTLRARDGYFAGLPTD